MSDHDHDHELMKAEWKRGRAETLAHLRGQVLLLPYVLTYGTAEVKRDDVLALIDRSSDG